MCDREMSAGEGGEFVRVVRNWRLLGPRDRGAPARAQMRLWPVARGSEGAFLNPLDAQALRTLAELHGPASSNAVRALSAFAKSLCANTRLLKKTWGCRFVSAEPLPPGVVALLRSQKLIVVDRHHGLVYKLLRHDDERHAYLLELEAKAAEIVPEHTIPTLFAQLDHRPRFIVQPYVRAFPRKTWRDDLPDLGKVVDILFRYYTHFGLEEVTASSYVEELFDLVAEGVHRSGLGQIVADFRSLIERELAVSDGKIILTRVHGDLISAHITWPVDDALAAPILVDWSESHRYSVFHDLFYFQFQNHDTDLWDRWSELDEVALSDYFGTGCETLWRHLEANTGVKRGFSTFRFNVLLCFLQELDHRLNRLHPRYTQFWVQQMNRVLASTACSRP